MTRRDIKRLWALAAGRCSHPGCATLCVDFLFDNPEPLILGDMAHVISKQPMGPRGTPTGGVGPVTAGRILLCPTHHRVVDAAPDSFPPDTLIRVDRRNTKLKWQLLCKGAQYSPT